MPVALLVWGLDMAKVEPIIEWQHDLQRTPQEVVNRLQELIDDGQVNELIVIWQNDQDRGYMPGCSKRKLTKATILWMLEHFKQWWMFDDG